MVPNHETIPASKSAASIQDPRTTGEAVTRFKEGRRIEAALKNSDASELEWAATYCRMRIGLATRKDHLKHWQALHRRVATALRATTEGVA